MRPSDAFRQLQSYYRAHLQKKSLQGFVRKRLYNFCRKKKFCQHFSIQVGFDRNFRLSNFFCSAWNCERSKSIHANRWNWALLRFDKVSVEENELDSGPWWANLPLCRLLISIFERQLLVFLWGFEFLSFFFGNDLKQKVSRQIGVSKRPCGFCSDCCPNERPKVECIENDLNCRQASVFLVCKSFLVYKFSIKKFDEFHMKTQFTKSVNSRCGHSVNDFKRLLPAKVLSQFSPINRTFLLEQLVTGWITRRSFRKNLRCCGSTSRFIFQVITMTSDLFFDITDTKWIVFVMLHVLLWLAMFRHDHSIKIWSFRATLFWGP